MTQKSFSIIADHYSKVADILSKVAGRPSIVERRRAGGLKVPGTVEGLPASVEGRCATMERMYSGV